MSKVKKGPTAPLNNRRTRRIDNDWRRRMREQMERLGITAAELGRQIGCSKASVCDALSDEKAKPTWSLVDAAEEALARIEANPELATVNGRALPRPAPHPAVTGTRDSKLQLLAAIFSSMSDERLDEWLADMTAPRRRR